MKDGREKDLMRIKGIIKRAEGDKDKEAQLAVQMANSIDKLEKATGRKEAALELKLKHIADAFEKREKELMNESIDNLKHLIVFEKFNVSKNSF